MTEKLFTEKPFFVQANGEITRIKISEVALIRVNKPYCEFVGINKAVICTINSKFGVLMDSLEENVGFFAQVNRSVAVNIWAVKFIVGKNVILSNGESFQMSDAFEGAFKSKLNILKGVNR